jgi:hypothetical protein
MKTIGSIIQLVRNQRPGYILAEDGCLVAFNESCFQGLELGELSVGDWVEYEELEQIEGRRASRIRPLIQRAEE